MESAPPAQQPALSAATSGGTAGSQNAGPGGLSHPEPQIQHRANPESASGQAQTPTARPVFKMKRTGLSGAYPFAALGASRLSSSSVSKPPTISGSPSLLLRPSTDPPNKATTTATKDATPTSQANGTPSLSRNSLPQLRQTEEEKSRFLAPVRPVPNRTSVVSNTSAQGDDASARSSVRNSFFNDTRNGKNNSDDGNEDSDVGMADANCVRSALENRRASIRKLESTNHSASIDQQPYKTVKDNESGEILLTAGALLPEGYTKSDNPDFPWICPIRDCRRMLPSLFGLGKHFCNLHPAASLNDNLDGTLTDIGTWADPARGDGKSGGGAGKPPKITRKKAMTLVESPLVEPKLHARAFEQSMPKRGGPRHQGTSDRMLSSIDDSHDLDNETDSDTSLKENVKSRHSLKGPSDTDQGKQSDTQHFEMANPDRSYSMWPNEYGLLQRAFGALLPDGYELDKTVSSRPWICPVRSCRRLFKVCSDLGYHFKVHHRGRRLNDNLDGTFSILNSGLVLPSEISEPPVVISRDPTNNELLVNPQRPNSKGYWVPATGEDMSVNNPDMSQESNSKHPGIAATHKSGTPETKIAADETLSVVGIEMATKDRRYTQWHDPETGMLVDMKGILVPEDYKLDYTIPGRPFICPIRSCRIACMSKKGLAKHFHNTESHTNVALNDNLDGTFSIVDSHTRERPATIVVSQNPLDPNEPPKAKPSLPPKLAKRSDHFPEVADLGSPREPSLDLTNLFPVRTLPTDPSSDPDSLWRHITSHIKDIPPYQSHEGIQYLLRLPHLRNLRPIRRLTSDLNVRQVAAVIIQATGQERDKPCTSCRRAGGPFDGCVNSSVADGIKLKGLLGSYSRACANCLYNTVANACSVKAYAPRAVGPLVPRIRRLERLERLQSSRGSLGAAADRDISMDTSTVGDGSFGERRQQSSRYSAAAAAAVDNDGTGDDENEDGMDLDEEREEAPARRQANRMSSLSETPSEPRQRRLVTLRSPRASVGAGGTGSGRLASSREVVRRRRPGVGDASSFQAQIQQQRSMPPSQDVLEMEEWELADGRIMAAGNEGNGLAFSASYLSANQMVQVSSNVTFLAITVPSGGSYRFVEDWQKTRVCSLANGKLKVQVDGEAEFVIGMNGVFRIGKGLGCVVMNRGYVDSMLHVTALVDGF